MKRPGKKYDINFKCQITLNCSYCILISSISLEGTLLEMAANNMEKDIHGDLGVFTELEPTLTALSLDLQISEG